MPNRTNEVLLLCPTGQDAVLIAGFLEKEGIGSVSLKSIDEFCNQDQNEAGVLLIADEALSPEGTEILNKKLSNQEAWSDLPIILLTSGGARRNSHMHKRLELFVSSGNVTLLERPLQPLSLMSATKVALRSRRRQFEVKELLMTLVEATKIRDEFISIASHELKTPLTSLKLQTQMNKRKSNVDSGISTESMNIQFDYTINQIDRLNKLVDDMLDISRLSTGKLQLQKSKTDLSHLLKELVERFTPQFEAVGISVTTKLVPNIVGNWDSYKLEQVINNIFSNAIRYAPENPMEIRLWKEAEKIVLNIQDFGPGIEKNNLTKIFDRYERASSTRGGLGLGLYITKQIVELHEGSIRAESKSGEGTTFVIELPVSDQEMI